MYNKLHKKQLKQFDYFARKLSFIVAILFVFTVLYVQPLIHEMNLVNAQLITEIATIDEGNQDLRVQIDNHLSDSQLNEDLSLVHNVD